MIRPASLRPRRRSRRGPRCAWRASTPTMPIRCRRAAPKEKQTGNKPGGRPPAPPVLDHGGHGPGQSDGCAVAHHAGRRQAASSRPTMHRHCTGGGGVRQHAGGEERCGSRQSTTRNRLRRPLRRSGSCPRLSARPRPCSPTTVISRGQCDGLRVSRDRAADRTWPRASSSLLEAALRSGPASPGRPDAA